MQAIKAIYDGVNFTPIQPVPVNENYEVIIIFANPIKPAAQLSTRANFIGMFEGKIRMADDFNEPIEEMMEYM